MGRLSKTTQRQFEEMLKFLEQNKIILTGKTKPADINKVNELWDGFSSEINFKGYGPSKSGRQWCQVFKEWKGNVRRKRRAIAAQLEGPRKRLTHLEERLLELTSTTHSGDEKGLDSLQSSTITYVSDPLEMAPASATLQMVPASDLLEIAPAISSTDPNGLSFVGVFHVESLPEKLEEEDPDLEEKPVVLSIPATPVNDGPSKKRAVVDGKGYTSSKKRALSPPSSNSSNNRAQYTSNILHPADQQYNAEQRTLLERAEVSSEGLKALGSAIINFRNEYKRIEEKKIALEQEKLNLERTRLKLQRGALKLRYHTCYGRGGDFDEFLNE